MMDDAQVEWRHVFAHVVSIRVKKSREEEEKNDFFLFILLFGGPNTTESS